MTRFQRIGWLTSGMGKPGALVSVLALGLSMGACSADVGRFDQPTFNLNGKSDEASAAPTPSEPMVADRSPVPGPSAEEGVGVDLPPQSDRSQRSFDVGALPAVPAAAPPPRSVATRAPERAAMPVAAPGDTIEVQRGDTLYSLARRNNVTVNELMAANGLGNAMIRPGQKLRLPGGATSVAAPLEPKPAPAPRTLAAKPAAPPPAAAATGEWGGSYTVQAGDSLYRIARKHNVRIADLQSANAITNPRQLKPGAVLRVPGSGGGVATTPTLAEAKVAATSTEPASSTPAASAPPAIASTTQPTVINSEPPEKKVAALDSGRMSDAAPAASVQVPAQSISVVPEKASAAKLRWPSKGKVISGFGQRPDGTHNDGINIAVPQGTDVHAADEGEVAYAGSELKGYGNLILVRHDNGWVTAYAHTDQMLVKRGDKVRRGDIIAKAGKSGQVDQPQLHFELRQGSKPVDPLPYLDRS